MLHNYLFALLFHYGPCKPDFYSALFHLPDVDTYLDCGYYSLPLGSPSTRVCSIFQICISYGIYETDHCSLYYFFILMRKKKDDSLVSNTYT
jgi:hypothetical protein